MAKPTPMYRGDDEISVPEELVSAMTGRGWSTTKKNAGENHPPVAPDSTPEGAPAGTTKAQRSR